MEKSSNRQEGLRKETVQRRACQKRTEKQVFIGQKGQNGVKKDQKASKWGQNGTKMTQNDAKTMPKCSLSDPT